jgi:hypothetical protein
MKPFKLPRRAFLAGIGGTAVSLPFLEIMGERAKAGSEYPLRYLVCFAGVSLGMRNLDRFVPDATGPGFDLPRALRPLELVRDDVTLITGMKIPWNTGGGVPEAGRPVDFHSSTLGPLLSGMRSSSEVATADGPTSEQLVADAMAADTRFRTLEYRVQAEAYRGGGAKGRMCYARDSGGTVRARDPIASPRLAYDMLMTGFVPDDPMEAERRRRLLEQDRSVLDLVKDQSERLEARLGRADALRLEQHFAEIRALEQRIAKTPTMPMSMCMPVADPGEDTPASTTIESAGTGRVIGYADEEERARVMSDLIHMAFTCDLTRSAALMYSFAQSFMSVESIIESGLRADMHELGHGAGDEDDHADGLAWHMRHWAYLVDRLRNTMEGDASILDRSAIVLVFEGGHGYDPESGNDGSPHSSENMAALIAGGAGGLRPRGHVVARDQHPAQVLVSAMNAVGVSGGLGEVPTGLGALGI